MAIEKVATRRKFPRISADTMLSISPLENEHAMGLSVDVSHGGMLFQCVGLDLEIDQLIKISVTLGRQTKTVVGKVVRVKDLDGHSLEVAVNFVEIDDETQKLLAHHLIDF